MAIVRNKITDKGFFTEKLGDGYNELVIDGVQQTLPPMLKVSSGSTNVSIVDPVTMITTTMTATLPQITNANVGRMFVVTMTGSGNGSSAAGLARADALLTSSNQQLINGSGLTRVLSGSCNVAWCIAAKTPMNTFTWIVASGSAL